MKDDCGYICREAEAELDSTIEKVKKLRKKCFDLELENAHILDKYGDRQLAKIYNGIGPNSFPDWIVGILDVIYSDLSAPCMIHDIEWMESDGTRESFNESNERLKRNGNAVAKKTYRFFNPKRYFVMLDSYVISSACQMFGWDIWLSYDPRWMMVSLYIAN